MNKLISTFVFGIWLYVSTFLVASPTFAVVTSLQTTDKLEIVNTKNSEAELTLKSTP